MGGGCDEMRDNVCDSCVCVILTCTNTNIKLSRESEEGSRSMSTWRFLFGGIRVKGETVNQPKVIHHPSDDHRRYHNTLIPHQHLLDTSIPPDVLLRQI